MKNKLSLIILLIPGLLLASCGGNNGGGSSQKEEYHIVRPDFTPEYNDYSISPVPTGVNMTFYSDMFSRGFSWITDTTVEDTDLFLVESDQGENADFSNAEYIEGVTTEVT